MEKKIKINYRNRLPHIAPIGATFFVSLLPSAWAIAYRKQLFDN
jgi:hypothetical protein